MTVRVFPGPWDTESIFPIVWVICNIFTAVSSKFIRKKKATWLVLGCFLFCSWIWKLDNATLTLFNLRDTKGFGEIKHTYLSWSLALSQKHVPISQYLGLPHLARVVSTLGLIELAFGWVWSWICFVTLPTLGSLEWPDYQERGAVSAEPVEQEQLCRARRELPSAGRPM